MVKINEAEAFNSIVEMLTQHHIKKEEYLLKYDGEGGFEIAICPKKRVIVIDVMYILENTPDIKVFRLKTVGDRTYLILKIKIRE